MKNYLKENVIQFVIYLFTVLTFWVVCFLYQLELEALWYAVALSFAVLVAINIVRFCVFRREAKKREMLKKNLFLEWKNLEPGTTIMERDYREMLEILGEECSRLATEIEVSKRESADYYTTWVHQIKTPIAVMKMQIQGEDTAEHRAMAVELFRIEQYVEMVLCYIRLGSSSKDLVLKEYDINDIVRGVIHKFAPQFVQRKIGLKYEPVHKILLTDEKWMSMILEQLISNAIKYTYEGSVEIGLEGEELFIKDTGIGIAPEDLPRIFEKGFTGYNGRADKKATGLGLYLCRQAADMLHVKVSAESEPSKGSTFYVDLHQCDLEVE